MLFLGLLSLFFIALHAQCPQWSYDEAAMNGPSHWGDLCPQYSNCKAGQAQSPIDIVFNKQTFGETNNLQQKYDVLYNFTFTNIDYAFEGLNFRTTNSMSFFGSAQYKLLEFHFHSPAEHFINGVHFVHMDPAGNYAVLGFMYEESPIPVKEMFLSTLAQYIPQVSKPKSIVTIPSIDVHSQINTGSGFYHYQGMRPDLFLLFSSPPLLPSPPLPSPLLSSPPIPSPIMRLIEERAGSTTIPPCIPGVQFFIASTPIPADPVILATFLGLYLHLSISSISSISSILSILSILSIFSNYIFVDESRKNARPLQPWNNRNITLYSPPVTNPKPRQSRQWAFALGGGGLGLVGASFFGLVLYSKYKKLRGRGDMEVDMLIRK